MIHRDNLETFLLLESIHYKRYWLKEKKTNCKLLCIIDDSI